MLRRRLRARFLLIPSWLAFGLFISPAWAAVDGKTLATSGADGVPACAGCHGLQGEGNAAGFPALAGQPAGYLSKQLHDLASGQRANAIMMPIAKGLSDAQIEALSVYYAGLPATGDGGQRDDTGSGRELAVNGQWKDGMPACVACHGDGARGIPPHFPALAGQHAGYIESQLKAWKAGTRHNDADGVMAAIAKRLNDDQITAVATWLSALPANSALPDAARPDPAPARADAGGGYFQPPLLADLPDDHNGKAIRRGAAIFNHTHLNADSSPYVGNSQDCVNCHLNGGRRENAAPMWAAWVLYPKYRGKNHKINTMAERIQGCFTYSQNARGSKQGKAPEADSRLIADLQAYMYWEARGVPTGKKMKGQGYPTLPDPDKPFSPERGKALFASHCALCHGDNGQGTAMDGSTPGRDKDYAFPPLWGPYAYNWGAGMHRVNTAAAFIKANMPLGNAGTLSNQQAWDLAAYIDSKPRPQDPRYKGDLDATTRAFHGKRKIDYYGRTVDGQHLGAPGTLTQWVKHNPL